VYDGLVGDLPGIGEIRYGHNLNQYNFDSAVSFAQSVSKVEAMASKNQMHIARAIATVATFAAVIVGAAAAPASAAPEMIGDYVLTETNPAGQSHVTNWNVNPCGDGCVDIKAGAGTSRAQLIDGQWVIDMFDNIRCPDGTRVPYAVNAHLTWDPNSLVGTDQQVYTQAACGRPAGYSQTNQIQLRRAG